MHRCNAVFFLLGLLHFASGCAGLRYDMFTSRYNRAKNVEDRAALLGGLAARHEQKTGENQSLLVLAVDYQDDELVDYLLKRGVDINEVDYNGFTALHSAVMRRDEDLVKKLINSGSDPCVSFRNPLALAVTSGEKGPVNLAIVKMLVEHGARINEPNWQDSPLVGAHDPVIMKYLIGQGADTTHVRWRMTGHDWEGYKGNGSASRQSINEFQEPSVVENGAAAGSK